MRGRNAVQGRRITYGDIAAQDLILVQGLITLAQQGDSPLNDLTVAMATIALTYLRVRDDAWARMDRIDDAVKAKREQEDKADGRQ